MATKPTQTYSSAVKKNFPNSGKAPSSNGYKEDEKELLTKIRILNEAIDRFDNEDVKKKIEDIAKAVEKVLKNNENDRTEKQNEINELKNVCLP